MDCCIMSHLNQPYRSPRPKRSGSGSLVFTPWKRSCSAQFGGGISGWFGMIPSGKLSKKLWTNPPFLMGKSTIPMAIFNSWVSYVKDIGMFFMIPWNLERGKAMESLLFILFPHMLWCGVCVFDGRGASIFRSLWVHPAGVVLIIISFMWVKQQ